MSAKPFDPSKIKTLRFAEIPEEFFTPPAQPETEGKVREILASIRAEGDEALKRWSKELDGYEGAIRVPPEVLAGAWEKLEVENPDLAAALRTAQTNIRGFANRQSNQFIDYEYETTPGVIAGQRVIPIDAVGVYVPGGRYPLVSTLLMCAVPAQVVNVPRIVVCTPPRRDPVTKKVLGPEPVVLAACGLLGISEVYAVGGAQAIGAMAYGTASVPRVDKIVGPGNKYVTMAKREVYGSCGIDFLAGPTEVMIVADSSAKPAWVAADLIAQAEHDPDARPILVSLDEELLDKVRAEIALQLETLATAAIAAESLERNGLFVLVKDEVEAMEVANRRAPEHLEIAALYPDAFVKLARNFGSIFIGHHSVEALGDYSAGINHALPTGTSARYSGGLSVKDFVKLVTTLRVKPGVGLERIGKAAIAIGEAEGLVGHAEAVRKRMK